MWNDKLESSGQQWAMNWMTWVRFLAMARDLSLLHSIKTSFGAYLPSGYKGSFSEGKTPIV
jgi:hypothetical protein